MFDFNLSEDEAAIDIALAFYDEGYNVVPLQRSNITITTQKTIQLLLQEELTKLQLKD
jgi:uncharacterized protein YdaT